jgi:hypothetical protein
MLEKVKRKSIIEVGDIVYLNDEGVGDFNVREDFKDLTSEHSFIVQDIKSGTFGSYNVYSIYNTKFGLIGVTLEDIAEYIYIEPKDRFENLDI